MIVKGIRAISDFEYEFEMNQLNRKLAPEIESVYVFASPEYSFLSSTGVKEMATFGGDVSDLVPAPVAAALRERLRARVAADAGASSGTGRELATGRRNRRLAAVIRLRRVSFRHARWTSSSS